MFPGAYAMTNRFARISLLTAAVSVAAFSAAFAQSNSAQGMTNFLIDNFEDAGTWTGAMPTDLGIIRVSRKEGAPKELKGGDSNANKFILGSKVSYFTTGQSWFALRPPREVPLPGVTKNITVWAAGRNLNHTLKVMYRDFDGKIYLTPFGKLNYPGWQKLTAQIPTSVKQEDFRVTTPDHPRGITFVALVVECALGETTGDYFVYFDELRSEADTFLENNRDPEDPIDNW